MKLHIVTVGAPRMEYAKLGFAEYTSRLGHYHKLRITNLSDKHNDAAHLLETAGNAYLIALVIDGQRFSSPELAAVLDKLSLEGRELCFMIGGPDGLPAEVLQEARMLWSFSPLTLPHDLAMVVLAETLYRASTISKGQPYHH